MCFGPLCSPSGHLVSFSQYSAHFSVPAEVNRCQISTILIQTHCQMTAKSVRYHWSDGQGPLWRCLGIPGARLGVEAHSMLVLLAETPLPGGICVLLSTSLNSEIWWCGLWTCWCWVQPEVWPFLSPQRMEVGPLPPQPPFSLTLPYLQPCFEPFLCAWELKLLRSLFDCCKRWQISDQVAGIRSKIRLYCLLPGFSENAPKPLWKT